MEEGAQSSVAMRVPLFFSFGSGVALERDGTLTTATSESSVSFPALVVMSCGATLSPGGRSGEYRQWRFQVSWIVQGKQSRRWPRGWPIQRASRWLCLNKEGNYGSCLNANTLQD